MSILSRIQDPLVFTIFVQTCIYGKGNVYAFRLGPKDQQIWNTNFTVLMAAQLIRRKNSVWTAPTQIVRT